jgi:prepilin-type N-terminal cleavage/methylation domain-containing protein
MMNVRFKVVRETGLTLIELLIGIAVVALIALTVSYVTKVSFDSNQIVTNSSKDIYQSQQALNPIVEEIKYGKTFQVQDSGSTLAYSDYSDEDGIPDNTIQFISRSLKVTRGVNTPKIYSIPNLKSVRFTVDPTDQNLVQIDVELSTSTFSTKVRALNP